MQKLIMMKPTNVDKIKEEEKAYNTVNELYKKGLNMMNMIKYQTLKNINKKKKIKPKNLKFEGYDYDGWFTEKELDYEEHLKAF